MALESVFVFGAAAVISILLITLLALKKIRPHLEPRKEDVEQLIRWVTRDGAKRLRKKRKKPQK